MENNYRIHTNVINDTVLNVNLKQDFDNLEVLSLKLRQEDAYKLHSSSYGVIIGRVLANDAFGIPNAKVSVFIEKEDYETNEIENLYPYKTIASRDTAGRRYNLLPDTSDDSCYRIVGTFPQKRLVLDEGTELEIYEKYWKYTTVTNEAGDYMIFGVPEGSQNLHLDIDLSDIGMLSQKPRDFEYKGYNINQFDNASQFKESTNLDGLAQIFSQDKGVYVYPFWGDEDNNVAAITRADFQVQYKFEPTCVFMGSIMSDNQSNSIGHKCEPSRFNGYNDQLVTGEGTIEMIRKTVDGLTEEYQIQGNQLINENGVWCYQIPMNLDYIGTDEYGNIVPVDSPSKGIPTRARVRFRISKIETGDEGFSRHTAKYLVPNNIPFSGYSDNKPVIENGNDIDDYFEFGSSTPTECYRDLYWNKVYSVKNYIPRLQIAHRSTSKLYSGIRATNLTKDKAIVPFNKLRFDIPFTYSMLCLMFKIIVAIVTAINVIIVAIDQILCPPKILGVRLWCIAKIKCISVAEELTIGQNMVYYPGCDCGSKSVACGGCPKEAPNCQRSGSVGGLNQNIEQKLAEDYNIAKLDFYDDWLNGTLYMPLWRWRKRRKKSFLFGLIHSRAKSEFCTCDKRYTRLKKLFSCSLPYKVKNNELSMVDNLRGDYYHKDKGHNRWIRPTQGIIKEFLNKDNLEIYYYTPGTVRDWKKSYKEQKKVPYVRMFATDIILLGSLNENDIDGVPQLFKYLPSTTENTPRIAKEVLSLEKESATDMGNASDDANSEDILADEESSVTTTTGMDWGRKGNETKNVAYGEGLFMDIDCWSTKTKPKSCINVERLCELGVSFDSNYELQYGPDAKDKGEIFPDGMITKFELDGIESRAMFATLNHVGFIPSSENQILNKTTGYKSNKFEYLYPTDFDGRLASSANAYVKSGYMQITKDIASRDYENFRFGSDNTNYWYFYLNDSGRHFPVYNNSFYFYFGLNPGKTAIDKFNQLFFAECYTNKKYPFSIKVTSKANNDIICSSENMGYILIKVDDIDGPYYVQLFDYDGNEVGRIEDLDSNVEYVAFGGYPDQKNGTVTLDTEDRAKVSSGYTGIDKKPTRDELFVNGNYTVRVVDSNGRYVESRVELVQPSPSINYDTYDLSTKYFEETSKKQEICDNEKQYYGQIIITSVTIDNEDYSITGVDPSSGISGGTVNGATDKEIMPNIMYLKGKESGNEKKIQFGLYADEDHSEIADCLCDKGSTTQPGDAKFDADFDENFGAWEAFVYIPTTYTFKFKEMPEDGCVWQDTNKSDSTVGSHIVSTVIQINNGDEFNLLINSVPFKFMAGTTTEDSANYSKNFYKTTIDTIGWYKAYDESVYGYGSSIFALKKDSPKNIEQWAQFIDFDDGIKVTNNDIMKVLLYKFSNLFTMAESIHMTEDSSQKISVDSVGGSGTILARMLRPAYEDFGQNSNSLYLKNFIFGNDNKATNDGLHPTIVPRETATIPNDTTGWNDHMFSNWENASGGTLNKLFTGEENSEYIYNYFAQFTKNGGIVALDKKCKTDSDIKYQSIPYKASTYAPDKVSIYGICAGDSKEVDNPKDKYKNVIGQNNWQYPYIAIPFIDRRFDYDLEVFTPNNISGDSASNAWKIGGYTYNGIEMAYDDNHQIIGSDEYISHAKPTRLGEPISDKTEFEYTYETESATTIFNPNEKVWRMPYDLLINGSRGLDTNGDFVEIGNEKDIKVWFKKELRSQKDFSRDTYPLKHELSISGTTSGKSNFDDITFEYTSCSYDITPEYDDTYSAITAVTTAGESADFTIIGNNVLSYTQNGKEYNLEYSKSISNNKNEIELKVNDRNIAFHINIPREDGHNIYVYLPVIINQSTPPDYQIAVLKGKTAQEVLQDAYKYTLPFVLDEKKEYYALYTGFGVAICTTTNTEIGYDKNSHLFKNLDGTYLTADNYLFTNMTFIPTFSLPEDANFSIMFIREYMNKDENYMNRHIRVVSMTDPIDTSKPLIMKIESNDGKKIAFSVKCDGFNFDNAEYYFGCNVSSGDVSSSADSVTDNNDGTKYVKNLSDSSTDKDGNQIIEFKWSKITTKGLANANSNFFAKLSNGLILKASVKFNSTVIDEIKEFAS